MGKGGGGQWGNTLGDFRRLRLGFFKDVGGGDRLALRVQLVKWNY